ncbi:MAG: alpha-1,2-fucosyltransferase [Cyclobacteriaceae bacterium]|nr:alpha-1,2-fucosyltransferase [Cyclobacteriaceae bacterium]
MIIVRLRGGLGNQLFQYAAGSALAEHYKTELTLDLYTYTKHPYRKFELSKFNIDAREATRKEIHQFTGSNPIIRYLNKRENYFRCPTVFVQPHYHFYPDFLSLPSNLYLSGYWQSEKYFESISEKIRLQFSPSLPLDSKNEGMKMKMQTENSIAVHVRRGDYGAETKHSSSFFKVLPMDYYQKAISKMNSEIEQPIYYFFSDDSEWARKNFTNMNAVFVDHNKGNESYKDLLLMSACKHNIIANSTFSWWGAWLNRNSEKKIIAPQQWFGSDYLTKKEPVYTSRLYNTKDLIPESWVRL